MVKKDKKRTQKRKTKNNKKRTQKKRILTVKGKKNIRLNELSDALNSMTEEGFQNLLTYLLSKEIKMSDVSPTISYDSDLEREFEAL